MDLVSAALAAAIFALFVYWIYENGKPPKNFPPGPWRLPIVGNGLGFLTEDSHKQFAVMHEAYGPIMGIQLGPSLKTVFLNDPKLVKEAYMSPVFTAKPDTETFFILQGGKYGLINSDGDTWAEQRRFALRHLRDLGFGKSHMEDLIMEEVTEFITWLKAEEGHGIELGQRLSMAVLNSIWVLLHGNRYQHDDPMLQELFKKNHEAAEAMVKGGLLFIIPFLAKTFANFSGYNQMMELVNGFREFFTPSFAEHKKNLQPGETPRDLVDAFLQEMEKKKGQDSSFNEIYGDKNLFGMNADLFVAGHETTMSTILWFLLYVTTDPNIQNRIHEELDRVVGKSRRVSIADRPSLPYLEAVMEETFRKSSIVPGGVPHCASQNVEFHGYQLPKGVLVFANIYGIHHNPEYFPEPDLFKPERFLNKDGTFQSSPNVIPFSLGKRQCAGELMARNEFYLFAANILQRFQLSFDKADGTPSLEAKRGFVLQPRPFKLVFVDRQK